MDVVVNLCQECGAPLPPDGKCAYCAKKTQLDDSMQREQASRREAEALFATLGRPPTWWQRLAVGLINPWLWLFGFPFLLGIFHWLSSIPSNALASLYERLFHARMMHVVAPWLAWLLDNMWSAGMAISLLILSLYGERVDARRELQIALAAKPPRTRGGPALCRQCGAPLEVPAGALGIRCASCGADNLVRVPEAWTRRAAKIAASLRLNQAQAKQRAAAGRKKVLRAALWRVPLVFGLLAFLILPAWHIRQNARFSEYRSPNELVDVVAIWQHGRTPKRELRVIPYCNDRERLEKLAASARLTTTDSQWCEWQNGQLCDLIVMMPLVAGESLRLDGAEGKTRLRLALGDTWYVGGMIDLSEGFGQPVPADQPVKISGWYRLNVLGPPGVALQPCIARK